MNDTEYQRTELLQESLPAPQATGNRGERAREAAKKRSSRALILAAFAAVYLIWGSTFLGIKYAIETLPPFLMAGTRFLVAGALLYAWARVRGQSVDETARPRFAHWRTAFIIGGLLLLCGNGGVTWAELYLASGLTALLVATEPLWVVLLNWALPGGTRPNAKVLLGLLTGVVGVWLLVSAKMNGSGTNGGMKLFGVGSVIAATFAWAAGSVYSARTPAQRSTSLASGMQMLAGGALLVLAGLLAGEWTRLDLSRASWLSIGALLYLIVFGSLIAFTAYSWLLHMVAPARAATYAYVNPVVAVILGWALAGEPLTARTLLAAGVIVGSVVLITIYGKEGAVRSSDDTRQSENGGGEDGLRATARCPNHPCA